MTQPDKWNNGGPPGVVGREAERRWLKHKRDVTAAGRMVSYYVRVLTPPVLRNSEMLRDVITSVFKWWKSTINYRDVWWF